MVFLLHFQIWLKIMKGLTSSSGENWLTDKEKDNGMEKIHTKRQHNCIRLIFLGNHTHTHKISIPTQS